MWSSFLSFVNFMRNLLGFRFIRRSSNHTINIIMIISGPVIFRLPLFSLFKLLGLGLRILSPLNDMLTFTSSLLYIGRTPWDVLHLDDRVLMLWLISFPFFGHVFFVLCVFQLLVTCCNFGGVRYFLVLHVIPALSVIICCFLHFFDLSLSIFIFIRFVIFIIFLLFRICFVCIIPNVGPSFEKVWPLILWRLGNILRIINRLSFLGFSISLFEKGHPLLFLLLLLGKSWPLVASWVNSAIHPIKNVVDQKPRRGFVSLSFDA